MGYHSNLLERAEKWSLDDLSKLHTRELLKELNGIRVNRYDYDDTDYKLLNEYKNKVKTVLSTREHVPNKKESKKIRQEKAKRKK